MVSLNTRFVNIDGQNIFIFKNQADEIERNTNNALNQLKIKLERGQNSEIKTDEDFYLMIEYLFLEKRLNHI